MHSFTNCEIVVCRTVNC